MILILKKYRILLPIVILTSFLIILNIILGYKIINLLFFRMKDENIAIINKENLIFGGSTLTYFFEPKPNNVEIDKPKWLEDKAKYTINADSLNERYEYVEQKPANVYRIITLGASFTFGEFVNTQDNYSEVLEDMLNSSSKCNKITHFEVINLGVRAYDIEYMVERFRKRGMKYNPDLVILLLDNGNFKRINEFIMPINNRLTKFGIPIIDDITGKYIKYDQAEKEMIRKYGEEYLLNYQRNSLYKFNQYYSEKLLIIIFPSMKEKYKTIVDDYVKERKDTYLNFLSDIPNMKELMVKLSGHPNNNGHRKISEDIYSYLKKIFLKNVSSIN